MVVRSHIRVTTCNAMATMPAGSDSKWEGSKEGFEGRGGLETHPGPAHHT